MTRRSFFYVRHMCRMTGVTERVWPVQLPLRQQCAAASSRPRIRMKPAAPPICPISDPATPINLGWQTGNP